MTKFLPRVALAIAFLTLSFATLAQPVTTFVFVKVSESIEPIERGKKYEDPLDAALKAARLGEVTGGGSSLSNERKIQWVGVDVELIDLQKGVPFLKRKLIELGAPKGSTLEYTLNGKKVTLDVHN